MTKSVLEVRKIEKNLKDGKRSSPNLREDRVQLALRLLQEISLGEKQEKEEKQEPKYTLIGQKESKFIMKCNICANQLLVPDVKNHLKVKCSKCSNSWMWPDLHKPAYLESRNRLDRSDWSKAEVIVYALVSTIITLTIAPMFKNAGFLFLIFVFGAIIFILKFLIGRFIHKRRLEKFLNMKCEHGVLGGITDNQCLICQHHITVYEETEKKAKLLQIHYNLAAFNENDVLKQAVELHSFELERLSSERLAKRYSRKELSPKGFEKLIALTFRAMGYLVEETPHVGDGGKDLILRKDQKKILVECKQYAKDNPVGRPLIQQFFGAITEEQADGGFFVTSSRFTRGMDLYVQDKNIVLIDGAKLDIILDRVFSEGEDYKVKCVYCGEVLKVRLGVEEAFCSKNHKIHFLIKDKEISDKLMRLASNYDTRNLCPRCKRGVMVHRHGKYGFFEGCSRYPACKYTCNI